MNIQINKAPQYSFKNRKDVEHTPQVGCYFCLNVYSPNEIKDWTDIDKTGRGQTALCPKCGVDSVLPLLEYGITAEDLKKIHDHFNVH